MKLSLDDLRPDMVLAAAIHDSGGRLLVPAGIALTDKHLRLFQMWGIADAEVEGEGAGAPEEEPLDAASLSAAEAELRPHFRHADLSHPVVAAVFRYCVTAAARRSA